AGAVVLEEERAVALPDEGIEVAVAVDVRERGLGKAAQGGEAERVLLRRRKGRCRRRPRVLEEDGLPVVVPDEGVEIAVAVDVGERGRGKRTHVGEAERVGLRRCKGRCRRRPGVLEEDRALEV